MWNKIKNHSEKILSLEISFQNWCKIVIYTIISILAGIILLVFTVDPHYRYHLPLFYDTVYYELYATAPRLLRDLEYDTYFSGSSMARNFFLNDIDDALGGKSIKLAAPGTTSADLKKFFDIAVKAKGNKLKKVVFSLDIYTLNKSQTPNYKGFGYLYRNDLKEEYKYFFSRNTYSNMLYLFKRKIRPKKKRQHQTDKNRMFSTEYDGMKFSLAEVVKDAFRNERSHHTQTPANKEVFEKNLKENLIPMVKDHPRLPFIIYLPPYHIFAYCLSEHFHEADALIKQRTQVMKTLLQYPNVKLYDFQADKTYVCDPSFFSDVQHFSSRAAKRILSDLAADKRRLRTSSDVDKNEKELRNLIREQMPVYHTELKKFKEGRLR